jgi:alpha-glucosidase
VTIIDPGVKVDPDYALYREGQAGGHFVHHPDGREYNGSVWPGRSAFPDFHQPQTRA